MKPAAVIALCLSILAFNGATMGVGWWLVRQVVAMARADQDNARAEEAVFRQALLKMPSLVIDDPVMAATGRAVSPLPAVAPSGRAPK